MTNFDSFVVTTHIPCYFLGNHVEKFVTEMTKSYEKVSNF